MPPRPLIAGNWKMNGLRDSAGELGQMIAGQGELGSRLDLLICPPATLLMSFAERAAGSALKIGAQDCHPEASGAHTGDISAGMVADVGGAAVIVGHSERRADHGESDSLVRSKAEAAWRAGLIAIICVGETEQQRNNGEAKTVVGSQLEGSVPDGADAANTVIAYEPVWAIGTGRTPTAADVADMHGFIRQTLTARFGKAAAGIRLLYGGSVKPSNAAELLGVAEVDGALIGGASLKASDFLAIAQACP
jgi:triosephosphate isomerase